MICGYALQYGKCFDEKHAIYELEIEWDIHSVDILFACLGDFNELVGRNIDEFDGVHKGYGLGQRNLEGWVLPGEEILCNTWVRKERGKEEGDIHTGKNETKIDLY